MSQPPRIRLNQHAHNAPPINRGFPSAPPPSDTDLAGLGMPVDDSSLGVPVGEAPSPADAVRQAAGQQLQYDDLEAEIERRAAERARQMLQSQRAAAGPASLDHAIDPVPVHPLTQPRAPQSQHPQQPPHPANAPGVPTTLVDEHGRRFRNVGVPDQIAEGLQLRSNVVTEFSNIDASMGTVDTFTNVPQAHQDINGSVGFSFVSGEQGTEIQQDEVSGRDDDTMLFTNEIQMERRVDPRATDRLTFT